MTDDPPEEGIPSFENLTDVAKPRETYGRVHQAHLPPEERPGPMRVRGRNPAYKWFADLPDTDPVLCDRLRTIIDGSPGEHFRKIVYQAYSQHCYTENT